MLFASSTSRTSSFRSAMNLFSRSSLEGGLTLGDNIGGNIAPLVGVDHHDSKGSALKGDEGGSRERKFDEREGWIERRGKGREREREMGEDREGIAEKGQMPWRIFPLFVQRRTNNSPLVSGFYNWPEVVQLRKRDAGRPRRESSFAPPFLPSFSTYLPLLLPTFFA